VTNFSAAVIAGIIFTACALDMILNNGTALLFLTKKMLDLVAYISFWR
jgi:hypothetical protein